MFVVRYIKRTTKLRRSGMFDPTGFMPLLTELERHLVRKGAPKVQALRRFGADFVNSPRQSEVG